MDLSENISSEHPLYVMQDTLQYLGGAWEEDAGSRANTEKIL